MSDYVCGFFYKAAEYLRSTERSSCAFVSTNSISQGMQVAEFWPLVLKRAKISFARTTFKWSNLASNNAGVMCVIVGLCDRSSAVKPLLFEDDVSREVASVSPYLISGEPTYVRSRSKPISGVHEMLLGNFAKDDGNLICTQHEKSELDPIACEFLRPMYGGQEFIKGLSRFCFWIPAALLDRANESPALRHRFERVRESRLASTKKATADWHNRPYRFVEIRFPDYVNALIIPIVSSESREYLPVGLLPRNSIVNYAFGMYDAPLWAMSIIASRVHLVWIATVCGKMKSDFRYSNTLGWNTFPLPALTEKNKADLTGCAEDILLARESHFPATIADLYDPETMPKDLRAAHDRNDEVLERIFIGRRFRNDTERLEKLFELYTKMTASESTSKKKAEAHA
jgi:hypothetical protein